YAVCRLESWCFGSKPPSAKQAALGSDRLFLRRVFLKPVAERRRRLIKLSREGNRAAFDQQLVALGYILPFRNEHGNPPGFERLLSACPGAPFLNVACYYECVVSERVDQSVAGHRHPDVETRMRRIRSRQHELPFFDEPARVRRANGFFQAVCQQA